MDTSVMKHEISRIQDEIAKLKNEKRNWSMRRFTNLILNLFIYLFICFFYTFL